MTAYDVLSVALAEIGYIGKKSDAQLDDKTANISGRYTKYARDLFAAGYYNGNKNGYNYCAVFVDWCFYVAAGRNKTAATEIKPVSKYGASVRYIKTMFPADRITNDAKPGDQILFQDKDGALTHTGLVAEVNGDMIKTIEGNVANAVVQRSFKMHDSSINSYVRPFYADDALVTITESEYKQLKTDAADLATIRMIIGGKK